MLTDEIRMSAHGLEALIQIAKREGFVQGRITDPPMLEKDREKYPECVAAIEAMHREKAERDAEALYPLPGASVGEQTQGEAAA